MLINRIKQFLYRRHILFYIYALIFGLFFAMTTIVLLVHISKENINKQEQLIIYFHDNFISELNYIDDSLQSIRFLIESNEYKGDSKPASLIKIHLYRLNKSKRLLSMINRQYNKNSFQPVYNKLTRQLGNFISEIKGKEISDNYLVLMSLIEYTLTSSHQLHAMHSIQRQKRLTDISERHSIFENRVDFILILWLLVGTPIILLILRKVRANLSLQQITIEKLKAAYEEVDRLAYYDYLTDLPNRRMFRDRLNYALGQAKRTEKIGAVFYLDLDNFKRINDSLGHDAGDLLISQIGKRLAKITRSVDTISRISGDEFNVLLIDIESETIATKLAQKILQSLRDSFKINHTDIFITASIGITIFPSDSADAETLIKYADLALYKAKESGRNNFQFYNLALNKMASDRLILENNLRKAIQNKEFVLYYQPQVDLKTNTVISYEALVRWNHPEDGLISPLSFIPAAEDTGLIIEIGRWIIEQACQDVKVLQFQSNKNIKVAINISVRQVKSGTLLKEINDSIVAARIFPENIEIEITESLFMEEIDDTKSLLMNLQKMGVTVAIDDFGTGYSSLSYLSQLPFNTLKIDRSFIQNVHSDRNDKEIVFAIIGMAHNLGFNVVAEGVETEAQLELLKSRHCDIGQGYLFAKPLPLSQIIQPRLVSINH